MYELHLGRSEEILRTLPDNSVDSVVTDPPYHLTSIVKRFGGKNAAPAQFGTDGAFARASRGFMGKEWDGGDIAFRPEFWAEVWRVLKPGGHLLAFSGSRTYHRMAVGIEDAGFEIRDQIMWLYGSGFPKSHDVSKGIDKRGGVQVGWFGPWLRQWREENGIKQSQVAALFPSKTGGKTGCVANFELGLNMPTPEQFNLIRDTFGLPFESLAEAEREVIGQHETDMGGMGGERLGQSGGDITAPATEAAKQWQGWGTALKPAHEPICVARKPLAGTVAENVLQHGTGALNIDGCRVGRTDGRWPANVMHDGSDEVLAGFPTTASGAMKRQVEAYDGESNTDFLRGRSGPSNQHGDSGSAARFFYCAKASKKDRDEGLDGFEATTGGDGPTVAADNAYQRGKTERRNTHPTVKPTDLMRYLCRLVTPPDGTVLDPFMGSGSTGKAAVLEGFKFIGIDMTPEYLDIARARIQAAADKAALKPIVTSVAVERLMTAACGHEPEVLPAPTKPTQMDMFA